MAEIPIFEGGQSANEATIRPQRIGPEDPHAYGLEQASDAFKHFSEVFSNIQNMHDWNGEQSANTLMAQHAMSASQTLDTQPFTTPDDYMARAAKLMDLGPIQKQVSGMGLSRRALGRVNAAMAAHVQSFLTDQLPQAMARGSQAELGAIPKMLQDNASLYAAASSQGTRDHINGQVTAYFNKIKAGSPTGQGGFKPLDDKEIGDAEAKWGTEKAGAVLAHMTLTTPEQVGPMVTSGSWQQHPDMKASTPAMLMHAMNQAHTILNNQETAANTAVKKQGDDLANRYLAAYHDGTVDQAALLHDAEHYPSQLRPIYRMITGKPIPGDTVDMSPIQDSTLQNMLDNVKSTNDLGRVRLWAVQNLHGEALKTANATIATEAGNFSPERTIAFARERASLGMFIHQQTNGIDPVIIKAMGLSEVVQGLARDANSQLDAYRDASDMDGWRKYRDTTLPKLYQQALGSLRALPPTVTTDHPSTVPNAPDPAPGKTLPLPTATDTPSAADQETPD